MKTTKGDHAMRTSHYMRFWSTGLFLTLIAFTFVVGTASSVWADVGQIQKSTNSVLDGVENAVKKTGLPDAKKNLWEKDELLIKPFIKVRYDLTSNVFKAPDTGGRQGDNLWTFTPGFQWLKKLSKGIIGGAYEASFRYFTAFPHQNEQDQKFLVYANLFPTEKTYIRTSEKLEQTGATAGSSAFEPVDFMDNTVNVVAGYVEGDWTYELGYENFDRDFSDAVATRYNYNEDKYDLKVYRQVTKQIRLFSGFRLGWVDFSRDSSRDTLYYEFPVGFEGNLPGGFTAAASVGIHHRNLEDSTRNDLTHFVTNLSVQKTVNHDRTSIQGGFLRRPVESAFSTATTYDEKLWYGEVKHLMTPKLRARSNIYFGNRDFEERVFTGTRFVVGGAVFVAPPNQVKRTDDIFGFGFGFDYNVRKWLIMHLDYQVSRRNSNISALDYTENALSLGSTIPL